MLYALMTIICLLSRAWYVHMLVLMHEMPCGSLYIPSSLFLSWDVLVILFMRLLTFFLLKVLEYQNVSQLMLWLISMMYSFKGSYWTKSYVYHDILLWWFLLLLCDWWHSFIILMLRWCIPIIFHDIHMHSSLSFHSLSIHIYSVPLFYNGDRWQE